MAASSAEEQHAFRRILAEHTARYPLMQLDDVYKLVHQASLGSEHAVSDGAQAREWLTREVALLGAGPSEPVEDPISADGRVVRVHLRPYVAMGGDPARLLDAFIRTANEYQGSTSLLRVYWGCAEFMASQGRLGFPQELLQEYGARMEALGFPAVHHSEAYQLAYRPAYRVIVREFLPDV
jgi:hypothetical protein